MILYVCIISKYFILKIAMLNLIVILALPFLQFIYVKNFVYEICPSRLPLISPVDLSDANSELPHPEVKQSGEIKKDSKLNWMKKSFEKYFSKQLINTLEANV